MLLAKQPIGSASYLGGLLSVPEEFCWSWGQMVQYGNEFLCKPSKGEYVHLMRSGTSHHATARNELAATFLGSWLWMSDTDHAFEPDILTRMVTMLNTAEVDGKPVDVLTGLYRYKKYPHLPVLYHWDEAEQKHAIIAEIGSDGPLVEVNCAGAGCLLVRRSVFTRIREELGEQPFSDIPPYPEDFSFFARIRKLGIKAYCMPKVQSYHLAIKRISDEDFDPSAVDMVALGEK